VNAWLYVMGAVLAVLGRVAAHFVGARRETSWKRDQTRIDVLVDAWRGLERAARGPSRGRERGLAQALADIQLFGTAVQAQQAADVAMSIDEDSVDRDSLTMLLDSLREDLRAEMHLDRARTNLVTPRTTKRHAKSEPMMDRVRTHRRPSQILHGALTQ